MLTLKSEKELALILQASQVVANILNEIKSIVKPGISTASIDDYADNMCKEFGVLPAFKGYRGFPRSICISINDEVVHGIPNPNRYLQEGDIVGLDFGVICEGWYGDAAITVGIGKISEKAQKLVDVTRESLNLGIAQCVEGNRLFDIGFAIQNYVEGFGYSVVREFVGHGIGRALHEEPQVPNYGSKGKGMPLKVGMVLAIEPMINAGGKEVRVLEDGWTAVTVDHSLSAHFEHTVAITPNGPEVLSVLK